MSVPHDHGQPNGIPQPPPGMAIRVDRFTVTSASPMPPGNPGVPPMVPPGFGYIPPFVGGQQFSAPAHAPGFNLIPPPPMPNFQAPPGLAPQGLPLTLVGYQGLGMPMGMGIPPPQFPVFNVVPNPATPPMPSPPPSPVVKEKE